MSEPKKYVFYEPYGSGDTNDFAEARGWLEKNKAGGIYVLLIPYDGTAITTDEPVATAMLEQASRDLDRAAWLNGKYPSRETDTGLADARQAMHAALASVKGKSA